MRAQSETLVFILLFLLSIILFSIAMFWGRDIFQKNIGMTRVSSAEKFMKELDYSIQSLVKSDGKQEITYNVDGPIALIDDKTIETSTTVDSDISLPTEWTNISESSHISEKLDGKNLRIRLEYPEDDSYRLELFTEGPTLSKPRVVRIEKNSTYYEDGKLTIKIRITLV
ncbi:hypothetical protein A3K64_02640 [Candidatus Micrarchaeota archaeon RBG_16_36_9]|nr:MAG: hypothetical protein A3K64_02640 [Candidatus Micrarchaeota archaeon RBG_16_36_9]